MDQETSELRQQVEQAREHLGATIEELAFRANVPARVRRSLSGRLATARSRLRQRDRRTVLVAVGTTALVGIAIVGVLRRG